MDHNPSVTKYHIGTGFLIVEHTNPQGVTDKILVDVNLLLETLKSTDTRVGEWVNVMGYMTSLPGDHTVLSGFPGTVTTVQAIVLWSAGSVKLDDYEKILVDLQNG